MSKKYVRKNKQGEELYPKTIAEQVVATKKGQKTTQKEVNKDIEKNASDILLLEDRVTRNESSIGALQGRSDVVDVVGTIEELNEYDVSTLTINDVIKVLKDTTRDNAETYYRLTMLLPKTWTFIGSLAETYSKTEADNTFVKTARLAKTTGISEEVPMTQKAVTDEISKKQDTLVSGTNIKTINGSSILGTGDLNINVGGNVSSVNNQTPDESGNITLQGSDINCLYREELPMAREVMTVDNAFRQVADEIDTKQETLVSGSNIATINGENITQGGNVEIPIHNYLIKSEMDFTLAEAIQWVKDNLTFDKIVRGFTITFSESGKIQGNQASVYKYTGENATDESGLTNLKEDDFVKVIDDKELQFILASYIRIDSLAQTTGQSDSMVMSQKAVTDELAKKANESDVPKQLSQLSQDSTHRVVTDAEKAKWNEGVEPEGGYNRALFEAAGAVWHPESTAQDGTQGAYWLNGLEDITVKQMQDIYKIGDLDLFKINEGFVVGRDEQRNIRTIIPPITSTKIINQINSGIPVTGICNFGYGLEVVDFYGRLPQHQRLKINVRSARLFGSCPKLKKIIGFLNVSKVTATNSEFGKGSTSLEEVTIYGLEKSIVINSSKVLSNTSILYMIQNSLSSEPITITLHPEALARANSDQAILDALAAHPNVSLK